MKNRNIILLVFFGVISVIATDSASGRDRMLFNSDWYFHMGDPSHEISVVKYVYDLDYNWWDGDDVFGQEVVELKQWMLLTGNAYLGDDSYKFSSPVENVGLNACPYVQNDFDDSSWEKVCLPHDWAISGPFMTGAANGVGGGMGRLPSPGIGWYRKKFEILESDRGSKVYLDIDGAMSYSAVWLNGSFVGGWPYGYASWRADLTPFIKFGQINQLAIRIDNPPDSSRWYPGGGIYRNLWLIKTSPVHIGQWGVFICTENVSSKSADILVQYKIKNETSNKAEVGIVTDIYLQGKDGICSGPAVVSIACDSVKIDSSSQETIDLTAKILSPKLWETLPEQTPSMYKAVTKIIQNGDVVDNYETSFGIRSLAFDPVEGLLVNGKHVYIKGVNQHHDLGSLGAAFNVHAARRQLSILKEMGCNAIRMAHNPPAPELLELTNRMGFLVVDEIFDCWQRGKTANDFHCIFDDWSEQDLRAFIRRDRNHPSVIVWSVGNEVGEQYTGDEGAQVGRRLYEIAKQEDSTRPVVCAMNYAKPDMPLPGVFDLVTLNYQGEGIRNAPSYSGLKGINTEPLYGKFHEAYPDKMVISSENAAAVSSRSEYVFPVSEYISSPVKENAGGNPISAQVSSYELYTADFGSSADKVFAAQEANPFVAGGFVWSGWDYLGEPTPYYQSRSSYFGIIDLAGFKKDRFYLYQSHWRPDFAMAHILPHWNWPDRIGLVTPVHVFTSGDEAELFLNGVSQGRKSKGQYEYRLRWDDVIYDPGELKVIAYKNGKQWAQDSVKTTDCPSALKLVCDKNVIASDGYDLAFITASVVDDDGAVVPYADNLIEFNVSGPAEIVSTDNGNPIDFMPFTSHIRKAFNGHCLLIIRSLPGQSGSIIVEAQAELDGRAKVDIQLRAK